MQRVTLFLLAWSILARLDAAEVRCVLPSDSSSRCVIVGPAPLAHSTQVLGVNARGEGGDLNEQIKSALTNLDAAFRSSKSSLAQAVKLNVYVTQDSAVDYVEMALASAFSKAHKPAVSYVTGALPWPKALVAIDGVAVAETSISASQSAESVGGRRGQAAAILPQGPRVYISGQAEKGDGSMANATTMTLASLGRTLDFLGLEKRQVVQVKSFLGPMSQCADAEREIAAFFGNTPIPPCSVVEWKSTTPIEIEMIVAAADVPALASGPSVEVRTPPGMTTPAVYSRLTIARHAKTIYTSGLYPSDKTASPESQLRSLFTNLKQTLDASESDWMHLVKATYYVSNDELSKWHNTVRPDYFSPRRPPAASKAAVAGTGKAGHGITMDFIVVPGE